MRVEFHPEARDELKGAVVWYKTQQASLGLRFRQAVDEAIRDAAQFPERHPLLEQDVRRHLVRGFPYSVLYAPEHDYVLILAVMHHHREPGYWRHRIG